MTETYNALCNLNIFHGFKILAFFQVCLKYIFYTTVKPFSNKNWKLLSQKFALGKKSIRGNALKLNIVDLNSANRARRLKSSAPAISVGGEHLRINLLLFTAGNLETRQRRVI